MRALLHKEYRENHLLPWAGLLVSVALIVLSALWIHGYAQTAQDQSDLEAFCAVIVMLAGGILLMTVTSGLISSEAGTGSLTYLLGLPVSRSRIWLAKAIAGLGLAAVSALLLALPISLAMPGVPRAGHFLFYLPDLLAAGMLIFSVTLFCSTLLARMLSVLLLAPVLLALAAGGIALALTRDVAPLQYDSELSDLSFWALAFSPPFLLASWVAFRGGELLDTRRKWVLALPTLVAAAAAVLLLVSGFVRWQQRYVRSDVRAIDGVSLPSGGSVAAVYVSGAKAPLARAEGSGWSFTRGRLRSHNTVLVDLARGREITSWKGRSEALLSPDGRYALRVQNSGGPLLAPGGWEVYAAERGRTLYRGSVAIDPVHESFDAYGARVGAVWSPNSRRLALPWTHGNATTPDGMGTALWQTLVLMRPDGSQRRTLQLSEVRPSTTPGRHYQAVGDAISAWVWAPDGEALLLLSKSGELSRYSLADGSRTRLWRRPGGTAPEEWMWRAQRLALSPDGRRLAIYDPEIAPSEQHAGRSHIWICRLEGARVTPLRDFSHDTIVRAPLVWSQDSRTLFLGGLWTWREGQSGMTPVQLPARVDGRGLGGVPLWDALLIWDGPEPRLVDPGGRVRSLRAAFPRLASGDQVGGVSAQGQLLLVRQSPPAVSLLDPRSGDVKHVYP